MIPDLNKRVIGLVETYAQVSEVLLSRPDFSSLVALGSLHQNVERNFCCMYQTSGTVSSVFF